MLTFALFVFSAFFAANTIKSENREYAINGNFQSSATEKHHERSEYAQVDVELGQFLNTWSQAGGRVGLRWLNGQKPHGTMDAVFSVYPYDFGRTRVFAGGSLGAVFERIPSYGLSDRNYLKFDDTKLQWGFHIGTKSFIGEQVAINIAYRYARVLNTKVGFGPHGPFNPRRTDFDRHSLILGISLFTEQEPRR